MPRFVILEHDHPELHWDLMLETGSVLKTWRLGKQPELEGGAVQATPIADHRLAYLDYEGPVSGGRGVVRRWDQGEYELVTDLEAEIILVRLLGKKLNGIVTLDILKR